MAITGRAIDVEIQILQWTIEGRRTRKIRFH
jgi:hypothetical protein